MHKIYKERVGTDFLREYSLARFPRTVGYGKGDFFATVVEWSNDGEIWTKAGVLAGCGQMATDPQIVPDGVKFVRHTVVPYDAAGVNFDRPLRGPDRVLEGDIVHPSGGNMAPRPEPQDALQVWREHLQDSIEVMKAELSRISVSETESA